MTSREKQQEEFVRDYERELLALAVAHHWGSKGFELKNWASKLLPDGYQCPEEETYAELQNALQYLQWEGKTA